MRKSSFLLAGLLVATTFFMSMSMPARQAFSQIPPVVEGELREVSGTYTNSEFGVEITLPPGLTGIEIPSNFGPQVNVEFDATANSFMLVSMKDAAKSGTLGGNTTEQHIPAETVDPQCTTLSSNTVTLAGKSAQEIVIECNRPDNYAKSKIYAIDLGNQKSVGLIFLAVSSADYDQNIEKFESSVDTLKLSGVGVDVGVGLDLTTSLHTVVLADATVQVEVQSSSEISDFQFDTETKNISFKATGDDGTQGTTVISVGKVLKGPYTVSIDGQVVTDFETIESETTGEASIELTYNHSTKDVSITGAEVVPEFSTIAALILASVLLSIIGLGVATRKFGNSGLSSLFGNTR